MVFTKVELYGVNNDGNPRRYTIADATAVSKGQLLALNDERTAVATTVTGQMYAGIASEEKTANNGATSISCWTDGIFRGLASDAILIGAALTGGAAQNTLYQILGSSYLSGAFCIGYSLDAVAHGETASFRLRL